VKKGLNANLRAKHEAVALIKEKIQKAASFVLVEYKGVTVAQDTELRNDFRKADIEYKVLKNTLVRRALNELGYEDFNTDLNGTTAVAFSYGDALAPCRIVAEGSKKFSALKIKSGMYEKKYADKELVTKLASIPSKPVLLSMLLGMLLSPISGLAAVLKAAADKGQEAAN
jgi:large subunit ribosomal protein L10